jgi:hypothetical protein
MSSENVKSLDMAQTVCSNEVCSDERYGSGWEFQE